MNTDYLVIGAGSAGCVIASRLSETNDRVTLLEAGPYDWYPWIHIPAGVLKLLYNARVNWNYRSEREPGTGGRSIHWPRGRVLGGSSSINGMLYVRGNPADFDTWAQMGCRGWSFDDVLPYFRKSEHYAPGDSTVRGKGGVLNVEDYKTVLPLTRSFVEAAQQVGHVFRADLNGAEQEGVGYSQMTRNGRFRGSTARTFLAAARGRANLRIETNAQVMRLLFDGTRCTGAVFRQNGETREIRAAREVIVCGGAVNSPHLLQLSGIGPAEHLRTHGITPLIDAPQVGANLQDHYVARVAHRVRDAVSINQLAHGVRLAREVLRFALQGQGALTFGVTSAQVFCRSREGLASPDLQLLFTPASYDPKKFGALEQAPGMTVAVCPARPDSRGTILLRSPDPFEKPAIKPNYLSAPEDCQVLAAGIRATRAIFAAAPLARHSVEELVPGPGATTDQALRDYMRDYGTTLFHPVGTCRMGADPASVVDSQLRVRGIDGLRVIDASGMPTLTTGNTNAPTIMIAEKGADLIRSAA